MDTIKNLKTHRKVLFTGVMLLIFSLSFSQTNSNNFDSYSLDFINGLSTPHWRS